METTLPILAALTANNLIAVVVWLIVAGLIWWILTWALDAIGIPEPFNKVARVILILIVAVICINALLTLAGRPFIVW